MKRVIVWQRVDTVGLEFAEIAFDPLRIEGEVVLVEGGAPFAVSYRVDCDDAGMTSRASVRLKHAGARSERVLARSSTGTWTMDGVHVPELDGIADVDLSVTPSTNTPPMRRLALGVGQREEVTAAWLRFPMLDVVPLRQSYRRVSASLYKYEAPALDFAAELECDNDGVLQTYGGLWKRLTGSSDRT
jgi:uncharacterized protein